MFFVIVYFSMGSLKNDLHEKISTAYKTIRLKKSCFSPSKLFEAVCSLDLVRKIIETVNKSRQTISQQFTGTQDLSLHKIASYIKGQKCVQNIELLSTDTEFLKIINNALFYVGFGVIGFLLTGWTGFVIGTIIGAIIQIVSPCLTGTR